MDQKTEVEKQMGVDQPEKTPDLPAELILKHQQWVKQPETITFLQNISGELHKEISDLLALSTVVTVTNEEIRYRTIKANEKNNLLQYAQIPYSIVRPEPK